MPNAETDIVLRIFLIILLIMMSVFLAISEISLASARKMKLQICLLYTSMAYKQADELCSLVCFLYLILFINLYL